MTLWIEVNCTVKDLALLKPHLLFHAGFDRRFLDVPLTTLLYKKFHAILNLVCQLRILRASRIIISGTLQWVRFLFSEPSALLCIPMIILFLSVCTFHFPMIFILLIRALPGNIFSDFINTFETSLIIIVAKIIMNYCLTFTIISIIFI